MAERNDNLMARSYSCPTCGAQKGRKCKALLGGIEMNTAHNSRLRLHATNQQKQMEVRNNLKGLL